MPDTAQSTGRSKGLANLKATMWKPGQSGNPGGCSRKVREYRAAVEEQETPEDVCAVVRKLREMALEGSVPAARNYLEAVGAFGIDSDAKVQAMLEAAVTARLVDIFAAEQAKIDAETREGAITVTASEAGQVEEPSDDGAEKP